MGVTIHQAEKELLYIMFVQFCILLFLVSPSLSDRTLCSDFTAGKCQPDETQVLTFFENVEDFAFCENLCGNQEGCRNWGVSQIAGVFNCTLYTYGFLHSCTDFSGSVSTDIQFCQLQDAGSCNPACDICNDLVELDCEFNGNVVWESAIVVDDTECIQYLNLLSTMYGANYFSYSRETLMCRLFDSPARTCTGMTSVADESLVNT